MKIELNKSLGDDQSIDLENHLLEVAEEAYLTEKPDIYSFAVTSAMDVQSEELGNAIIDFISNNIPRVIIWKDGVKVVDKFDTSPLDLDDSIPKTKPADLVEALLGESKLPPEIVNSPLIVAAAKEFLKHASKNSSPGNMIHPTRFHVADYFNATGLPNDLQSLIYDTDGDHDQMFYDVRGLITQKAQELRSGDKRFRAR